MGYICYEIDHLELPREGITTTDQKHSRNAPPTALPWKPAELSIQTKTVLGTSIARSTNQYPFNQTETSITAISLRPCGLKRVQETWARSQNGHQNRHLVNRSSGAHSATICWLYLRKEEKAPHTQETLTRWPLGQTQGNALTNSIKVLGLLCIQVCTAILAN